MTRRRPTRRDQARQVEVFDPLALRNLQEVLRLRLEWTTDLDDFPPHDFVGAGVYAVYYFGDFDLYAPLKTTERKVPIYVGKAEAGNSSYGEPASPDGFQLVNRIKKHADSVAEASQTLNVTDFKVRYLPLDDAWIVLAERALLREYRPVLWNTVMPGFGANAPGSDRQNARSIWDTIHPGRPRAGRLCNRRFTLEEMRERVRLAVAASILEEGEERTAAIEALEAYQRRPIWRPKKSRERGPRVVVQDQARFLSEMARLGLEIPEHRVVDNELDPAEDPEATAERNTLVAEQLAMELDTDGRLM
ncbi:Eco29kI family restriction endonuclease [Micromonospora sp. SL4-19]|uniref:Eco29kI family restriction endonuclease n=1 Tax=Micromonospora sp. SL4-19 TaxID=3399129 RepID=UPI003A4D3FEC